MADANNPSEVVLLVDDEEVMRDALSYALESKGRPVIVTDGGVSAMNILNERVATFGEARIQAVVSDWMMAGGDGIALVSNMRKSDALQMIPFLLISGAVSREQLMSAMRFDIDGILLKPFPRETFLAKIDEAIQRRQEKDLARLLRR